MDELEWKNISRRDFLYSLGAFSFTAVFGISPIRVFEPATDLCVMNIERKHNLEGRINAAFMGVGSTGIDIGRNLSNQMGVKLQSINMSDSDYLITHIVEKQDQTEIERYLKGKDIVALVGSIEDQKFLETRKLLIGLDPAVWTVAICPPDTVDQEINLGLESREVLRLLRHSIYPLDNPEMFVQTVFDIGLMFKDSSLSHFAVQALCDILG